MLEILARTIIGAVLTEMFYWPGWCILRTVTLGRYPPSKGTKHNREFVALIGFAVLVVSITVYFSMSHG